MYCSHADDSGFLKSGIRKGAYGYISKEKLAGFAEGLERDCKREHSRMTPSMVCGGLMGKTM